MTPDTIAIILGRKNSKGIKDKNVMNILGKPAFFYPIEAAKKSKFIKNIFVSTDGTDIAEVAKQYGAKIIFRPKHLSNSAAQIEPAILHAIRYIEKFYYKKFDNIVLLQPTSPLRKYNDIDNAIKKFINNKADSLFSCVDIHPYIWRYKNSNMIPLNYRLFKRQNRQNIPQALIENGSIYVTKKKYIK